MIRLAFDIGGTFTDFVLHDSASGTMHTLKVPTTLREPGEAVIAGLELLLQKTGVAGGAIDTVLHATTVATNAVLERKGAATGLITTAGFRDVLIIGRQKRYETYDLYIDKPRPLVQRRHIVEVLERVDADGAVATPLDEVSVDRAIDAMLASGRETIAVSLLHAYARPDHERRIRELIAKRMPNISISISSDISPKFREYERTNTTVTNAYVKPIVDRYLGHLESALMERGIGKDLFVMQSSGGLISPNIARDFPVRIIESGPAAGILMCAILGKAEEREHVLTFDMGGTTAKLGAVDGAELGRGAAHVEREDMLALFGFAEDGTHQDAGGRSRFDDAHGEIAGNVGRDEAAARLHDKQVLADAALQQRAFQVTEVAVHDRLHVSVGDRRVGALVLTDLGRDV